MAAFHWGDAFLSRLEGEWWLRFQGGEPTQRVFRARGKAEASAPSTSSRAWTQG